MSSTPYPAAGVDAGDVDNAKVEAPGEHSRIPMPTTPRRITEARARKRRRVGVARSVRSRILVSNVVLLALAAILSLVAIRQVLTLQIEREVDVNLTQEVQEFERLFEEGRDPNTGLPFASLGALFDRYLSRNVPNNEEAFSFFVDGRLHKQDLSKFPVTRIPAQTLAYWQVLSSRPSRGDGLVSGRFETSAGGAYFQVRRLLFGDAGNRTSGAFVVSILPQDERDLLADLQLYGVGALLGVLLIASLITWFVAGRVLTPVRMLTDTAEYISQSNLARRVDVRGASEAADMARTFNAMLDRLENVFRNQREFVEDASHELRDPLTICRGHLELLGDDPEEQKETIALVLDELDRMGRIVDDLQLLAEVEQPDFLRVKEIDAGSFAHDLAAKASALAPRAWKLDHAAEGTISGDPHRLTEAVVNLAHNAVQASMETDTIAIGLALDDGVVRIWVRDTGTGIPLSDQDRIFQRFVRGRGAHRRYRGGGLGLAIVKAIAEAHGGHVELDSRLGAGSTFTLVFPADGPTRGANGADPGS